MKFKFVFILCLAALTGCSETDNAGAMKALSKGCAGDVSVVLSMSSWGNTVIMSCDKMKPWEEDKKK